MKKILITVAILAFASSIEAALTKTPRVTNRKAKTSSLPAETYHTLATESENTEATTTGSIKNRMAMLKQNIREGHVTLERTTQQIHNWTKELAPLEVQAHHKKSTKRGSAKATPSTVANLN